MWSSQHEQLADRRGVTVLLRQGASQAPFSEVLRGWQYDADFCTFFCALLADTPYSAFRWETPPLTSARVNRPFECVLLDSPELAGAPDPNAFADYLGSPSAQEGIVSFPNLSGDAILIVPCLGSPLSAYSHLRAFIRGAPEPQQQALWKRVGAEMEQRLGPTPIWLSTAGAGVSWLHVRLDQRPKYYGYAPYRAPG